MLKTGGSNAQSGRASIVRNLAWVTAGNILVKPAWLVFITAVCMRALGTNGYGELTTALAISSLVVSISDLGLSQYSIREVARNREAASLYFSNLLVSKLILGTILCLVAASILPNWLYGDRMTLAIVGASIYAVALHAAEFCRGFFRSFEVLKAESLSIVIERASVIAGGVCGLYVSASASGVLLGMSCGMIFALFVTARWVHTHYAAFRVRSFDRAFLRRAIQSSGYIGLLALSTFVLLSTQPLLIERISGISRAGEYGAAYRLVEASMLLPSVVCAAVIPRLALLYSEGDRALFRILRNSAVLLGLLALAIGAVYFSFSRQLLELLAGGTSFSGSVAVLRVLSGLFPTMSIVMLLSLSLVAINHQREAAVAAIVAALVNIPLGWFLTVSFGAEGAAASLVILHALMGLFFAFRLAMVARSRSYEAVVL